MKFFHIDGHEISKEEFILSYGSSYYIGNERLVPGLSQCSRFVEDEIDRLLKEGIKSKLDVVHILAWKIGKIKHLESDNQFVYAKDWANAEKFDVTLRKEKFDIDKMAEYIVGNFEALEEKATHDPQGVLRDLNSVGVAGIGPTYLLTLLYFISKEKYPIYDQFAVMAADAIVADIEPGNRVEYRFMPDKNSETFDTIMQEYMAPYIQKLNDIFGDAYQKSRDIDRAIWVYGHLFKDKERDRI